MPKKPEREPDPLPRLRALCLALPETNERLSHGEPTWFVRDKKVFVNYSDHHHDDRLGFWCAAPVGIQEASDSGANPFLSPKFAGETARFVMLAGDQSW